MDALYLQVCALCILLCVTSSTSVQWISDFENTVENEAREISRKFSEGFEAAEKYVKDGWETVETVGDMEYQKLKNKFMDSCSCVEYNCGCCAHLEEPEISLNSTLCTNFTYLVHDYGISFTVTVNNYAIFNETISARNPPPVCLSVPYVKDLASVCVRLYDINATSTYLHACVRVEARMKTILVAKYEFGCFNLGPPGFTSGMELGPAIVHVKEPCTCADNTCACCTRLDVPRINLDMNFCSNVTYFNPEERMKVVAGAIDGPHIIEAVSRVKPSPQFFSPAGEGLVYLQLNIEKVAEKDLQVCLEIHTNSSYVQLLRYRFHCFVVTGKPEPFLLGMQEGVKAVMFPVIASVVGILLVAVIAIVVIIRLRRRGEQYKRINGVKQSYGSTGSLVSRSDPYC